MSCYKQQCCWVSVWCRCLRSGHLAVDAVRKFDRSRFQHTSPSSQRSSLVILILLKFIYSCSFIYDAFNFANFCLTCSLSNLSTGGGVECEALYDYTPSSSEELEFKKGDRIELKHPVWYMGSLAGKNGWVPKNHVKIIATIPKSKVFAQYLQLWILLCDRGERVREVFRQHNNHTLQRIEQ